MGRTLYVCAGGHIALPDAALVLVDRRNGGNLIVNPPRDVWERSELMPAELTCWSYLVAATGRAMLETLPQLAEGCVNYWEAGNWALHEEVYPAGPKTGPAHRRVHLHILGRSRTARDPSWRWGEAPRFPAFSDRHAWASRNERLTADECRAIVASVDARLRDVYGLREAERTPSGSCENCGYPAPVGEGPPGSRCSECVPAAVRPPGFGSPPG